MQNIFEMQIMIRGMKYRMTNMTYIHTCTTSIVNLLVPIVAITYMQLLQLACDMISCFRATIPICVNTV